MTPDAEQNARRRAAADPRGWFERLYADATRGRAIVPWDRGGPHPILSEWVNRRPRPKRGEHALVVGTGLGEDAALLADRGWSATAFDISPSAITSARRRFPEARVDFQVADVVNPPSEWAQRFALVVEINTIQSMLPELHAAAIAEVARFVAVGGRLLVVASGRDEAETPYGPPWPLTEAEVGSFATGGLTAVRVEDLREPAPTRLWRAEFTRV